MVSDNCGRRLAKPPRRLHRSVRELFNLRFSHDCRGEIDLSMTTLSEWQKYLTEAVGNVDSFIIYVKAH